MKVALAALVLMAAAVVVHLTQPTNDEQVAPFVVTAAVGHWGQARTFGARVEDVGLADEVTDGDWTGTTDGVWVVVTLTVEAAIQPGGLTASLYLGDQRFDASDRPGLSAVNAVTFAPGLPERGDLVFELPASALRPHPEDIRLRLANRPDPRLDAVVDVPLDLGTLDADPLRELTPVERTTR